VKKDENGEFTWQYAIPDMDETDGIMELVGTPRYISPKWLKRKLRPDGEWEPVGDHATKFE
jgi:hypothetical protein